MNPLIAPFLGLADTIIKRVWPDPIEQDKARLELFKLQQEGSLKEFEGEVQIAIAQAATNTEEAKSPSLFKSGWRPAVGWVCVLGLSYQFIVAPLLGWVCLNFHLQSPPAVDTGTLVSMLVGMLGLGAMRMYEKTEGVASK